MPLQNRVAPDGELIATQDRGLLMGNRGGRFHDPADQSIGRRRWKSRAWICCELSFKDRPSPGVWGAHRYTELFFCDEVVALSAGHRPCMECRRAAALRYRDAVVRTLGMTSVPRFPEIDALLHEERLEAGAKRVRQLPAEHLPDGAMMAVDGEFLVLRGTAALVWSTGGYTGKRPRPLGPVNVLTPATSLAALSGGYRPVWHPTAGQQTGP
jgi:hypothetical protein